MDHHTKLAWARKHLDTLREATRLFTNNQPYVLTQKYDPEDSTYTARITEVTAVPGDWSLMVGDIVHSMRSALDTMAYSLAVKNLGRAPTAEEVKQIQFVIVDKLEHRPGECGRRLRHLSAEAQTVIQGCQPYLRADPAFRHALSVLRDLSNVDKHRRIIVTLAAAASSSIVIEGAGVPAGTTIDGHMSHRSRHSNLPVSL